MGEILRSEIVHRATVETSVEGTSQTAETRSMSIKAWKVTEVTADGKITFVHSVDSVDMWQRMQGRQEVRYNSLTDKEVPAGYETVAKAVGVPLAVITMDPHGKVLKREQLHPTPEVQIPQITMPLPERPVALGHVWTAPLDVDVMLPGGNSRKVTTQQKFTLEKVADGTATIHVETQVLTPINDPTIEAQLIQRLSAGTLEFDLRTGRMVDEQLDLDRRVIGFSGPASSLHYLTRFTEKLLPADYKPPVVPVTARQPTAPKRK